MRAGKGGDHRCHLGWHHDLKLDEGHDVTFLDGSDLGMDVVPGSVFHGVLLSTVSQWAAVGSPLWLASRQAKPLDHETREITENRERSSRVFLFAVFASFSGFRVPKPASLKGNRQWYAGQRLLFAQQIVNCGADKIFGVVMV